ncbi:cadherin-like domain-containing protein, partial [Prosthecochloris vibrioformis]
GELTASISDLADEDGAVTGTTYQWEISDDDSNWAAIDGATSASYTVASDQTQVAKYIRVTAETTDALGGTTTFTSVSQQVENVNDDPEGSVTIEGTVEEGQTLTANISTLDDEDGLGEFSYQWYADGDAIADATANIYTLTQSEVGKTITVEVSYTDDEGTDESVTSSATAAVANVDDEATGSLGISGTVEEGGELTASISDLADDDGAVTGTTYQWQISDDNSTWTDIVDATSATYTIADDQSQVDKYIRVTAETTDELGGTTTFISESQQVANVNDAPTGNVTIDGTVTEGETLTANTSTLVDEDGLGTLNYQWYAGDDAISGATASSYTLTQAEVGKAITVEVSYTDDEDTAESVTSASTVAVLNSNFDPEGTLTITGDLTQGKELTANADLTDPDGRTEGYTYTWYANGIVISGANQSTYTLTQAEVDKQIRVEVSYTDNEGVYESVKSLPTAKVANVNDAPTGEVVIEGSVTEGGILSANTDTLADPDGLGELSYQWYADDSEITGATESVYTLTQTEVGKAIKVVVSYTDKGGEVESVESAPTSVVTNTNNAPTGEVTIDGTVTEGQTLEVNTTNLDDTDVLSDTLTYQWKANGAAIVGATASTYTLTQAEVGKVITVVVSYTDDGGTKESVTSVATAAVANVDDEATGTLEVSGTVQQGEELSASITALADPDGALTGTTYQWQVSDDGTSSWDDIGGATGATFTLDGQSLVGKFIRVTAVTTDALNGTTEFTSDATVAVENANDTPAGSVTITGTVKQGEPLTADTSTLADADGLPATLNYRWYADGDAINDATSATYTLTQAEVGKVITVEVSFTDNGGYDEVVTSASTAAVENVDDEATGTLEITGTAEEGAELTASISDLDDEDGSTVTTYQWQISDDESIWTAIDGATSSVYALEDDQSQVGKYIRVTAETTDTLGGTTTFESASQQVVNVNDEPTGSVTIDGVLTQGKTLTANTDTLADADGLGTLSYQWYADGAEISDATSVIYKLTQDEVGKEITVKVTYTDDEGTAESVTSSATEAVQNVNDTPTGSVTIPGTVKQGETLTADASTLADADGLPTTLNYQWYADNEVIGGATEESYTLTQAEVGKSITVEVSYTDDQNTGESITSAATVTVREITNENNTPAGTVTVTGTVKQGETLTADTSSLADADGLPATLNYQWYADGSEIIDATSETYDLTQEEVGKVITVKVSYEDNSGNDEIVTSAATAAVENVDDEATGELEISGTVQEGAALSAGIATPADVDGEIVLTTYQWEISDNGTDWSAIAGATKATYTIEDDQSQVGTYIRVTAETTDELGGTTTFESDATTAVLNVNDDPTGTVTVSGTPEEGVLLRAVTSQLDDADGLGAFSFQWYANGAKITDATSATYELTQDEVGETITVEVSYTDGEGTAESVTSAATAAVANVDDEATGTLEISGTVAEGEEVTANLANVTDADGTVTSTTYQWQISEDNSTWTDIEGATTDTYTIADDQSQVGSYIRVTVETTDELGGTTILASGSSEVQNVNDAPEFLEGDIAPLLIIKGGEAVISATKLDPTDPDDGAEHLTYNLTSDVTYGTLWLDGDDDQERDAGEELAVGSTFTQADIDADLLFYSHNGGDEHDSFEFEVTDEAGESTGSKTFTITVYGTKTVEDSGVASESATVAAEEIDGAISPDDALTAFTDSLVKGSSKEEREEISEKQDAFLQEAGDDVTVRSVRVEPMGDVAEGEEVYLSVGGSADGTEALVLDLSAYESGTVVTIDFNDVDFAVVTGAISATGGSGSNILVADGAAQFVVLGEDDDTLDGGAGDDYIGSEGGDDYLIGGPGNDTVVGGADDDTLVGGADNDTLDGGTGNDTAVYSGDFDEYEITYNAATLTYTIKDTEDDRDGTDTVTGVENFEFADGTRTDILAPVVDQGIADRTVQENASVTFSILSTAFDSVDGDTLTYAAQLVDGNELPDWLELEGSTFTYSPGDDHQGGYEVTVTATDDSGLSASDTFTLTVSNVNAEPEGAPRIIGTARQNQELSVDTTGISDADGLGTLSYQWYADDTAITGATSATYTLTQAEVGKAIKVEVSYTDDEGT